MSRLEYFMESCEPEEILEQNKTESFDEFTWTIGGDVRHARVYGDSSDTYSFFTFVADDFFSTLFATSLYSKASWEK